MTTETDIPLFNKFNKSHLLEQQMEHSAIEVAYGNRLDHLPIGTYGDSSNPHNT
jgi:hypothetical protein